jgi:hypothetical protein
MPTFDGGHCYLTTLLPIKTAAVFDHDGMRSSPVHMVRDALAVLPTARQSQVTMELPKISPFARNPHTHFARFVVIEDVTFNGRMPINAILDQSDRTIGRPIDQMPCPYLLFTADIDAPKGTTDELRSWLRDVWTDMREDLEPVFSHCHGYQAKSGGADGFADYIIGGQVETTMPFNDYWPSSPPLTSMSFALLGAAFLAVALVVGIGLWALADHFGWAAWPWLSFLEGIAIFVAAIVCGGYLAYRLVMRHGGRPFPMAPNSDLPSVLKALYLQGHLIDFAIKMQGKDDATLHREFGTFLQLHQLNDTQTETTTQAPGIIPA